MRSALVLALMLFFVFLFTSCTLSNQVEYFDGLDGYILLEMTECYENIEVEVESAAPYCETIGSFSTFQISHEITLNITYVTEDFLDEFESFSKFIDTGSFEIAFITNTPFRDFRLIAVDGAEIEFVVCDELYFLDELSPDTPFVTTWNARGSMPHRGISFVDENDVVRYFAFHYDARGDYNYFRIQEFAVEIGDYFIAFDKIIQQAEPWQRAYISLLLDYSMKSVGYMLCIYSPYGYRPSDELGGVFLLHDINNDGIPELIVRDRAHFTTYFAVYTFVNDKLYPLEATYFYDYATMFFVPRGGIGLGMESNEGVFNSATLLTIDGSKLIPKVSLARGEGFGDVFNETWEDSRIWWSINGVEVSEEEHDEAYANLFDDLQYRQWVWGYWGYEITDSNIYRKFISFGD